MRANIDGDILLYAIGSFTNDHPFLKDKEGKPVQMPYSIDALHGLIENELVKITEGAGCDEYVVYLSGANNFREEIAVTHPYKFKRKDLEKPYHYQDVKDYLLQIEDTVLTEGIEADDALALNQTSDTVCCSLDKDLDMVPGLHYNWRKKLLYSVDYDEAVHWFMMQLLTGDWGTDSIIGCGKLVTKTYGPKAKKAGQQYQARVGIGEKAALNRIGHLHGKFKLGAVVECYKQEFGSEWETKLNEMANLLGMGLSRDNLWEYSKRKHGYQYYLPFTPDLTETKEEF